MHTFIPLCEHICHLRIVQTSEFFEYIINLSDQLHIACKKSQEKRIDNDVVILHYLRLSLFKLILTFALLICLFIYINISLSVYLSI